MVTLKEEAQQLLDMLGVHPKRSMGQNFLIDDAVHRRIVGQLDLSGAERVVEVGAGLGFLTYHLTKAASGVVALEKDDTLAKVAHQRLFSRLSGTPSLLIVRADVMDLPLSPALGGGNVRLVGNLPYNIAVPFLLRIARVLQRATKGVFLVQRELADRLTASPSSPDRGAPSVSLQCRASISTCFGVGASAFWPQPRVTSTVIRICFEGGLRPSVFNRSKLARSRRSGIDPIQFDAHLEKVVRASFSHRRKTLRNSLRLSGEFRRDPLEAALQSEGVSDRRAESLTVDSFGDLTVSLLNHGAFDEEPADE